MTETDVTYMQAALEEAKKAEAKDEVPIGAILVNRESGDIVARSHNVTRKQKDPTAHAEMNVIRAACEKTAAQRIPGHDLYVTLEPCPMCAAAISFARIDRVIYGAKDPKSGGLSADNGPSLYDKPQLHHKPDVTEGVLAEECGKILSDFFRSKR